MASKSDKLKKMEQELADLEQWLKLGLVPKKDEERHKQEIEALKGRIEEESERLKFLKESDEVEEYVTPKRTTQKAAFTESTTMADIDMQSDNDSMDIGIDDDEDFERSDNYDSSDDDDDDDDSYSDNGRFQRGWGGDILDPDSDEW